MTKKEVDNWITKNYDDLIQTLANFCSKYKLHNYQEQLFSLTYMHVIREDLNIVDEKSLNNIFKNFAYYQCKWGNSYLRKEINPDIKNKLSGKIVQFDNEINSEIEFNHQLEIQQDLDDKLFEHQDYMNKLAAIQIYRDSLTGNTIEARGKRKLAEMYFDEGINVDSALRDRLGCKRNAAAVIIRKMREEIRDVHTKHFKK